MGGATTTGDPKRVKFALTWSQRRAFVLSVVAFQFMVWADALLNDGRFGGGWQTAIIGLCLMAMAAGTWWVGTSVSRRGLVIHSLPTMRISWDDVHEIEVETSLGIRTVVVHHGEQRKTRLSAPTTGLMGRDDDFHDKVRVMRSYWTAHRAAAAQQAA